MESGSDFPKLSALELFVGFKSSEIEFLEKRILHPLRESFKVLFQELQSPITRLAECRISLASKQNLNSAQSKGLKDYVFRNDDGQSFGGEDPGSHIQSPNPFENRMSLPKAETMPRHTPSKSPHGSL